MKDLIAEYGPVLLAAIVTGLLTAVVTWAKTRNGWFAKLIGGMAEIAVNKQETLTVAPFKALNRVAKLPKQQQILAKANAISDVVDALTPLLGPVAAEIAPAVGRAVEAVIDRVHQRLPEATKDRFNKFGVLVLVFALAGLIGGVSCATLPKGWNDSNAHQMDQVAVACADIVYGPDGIVSEDPAIHALRSIGTMGAGTFRTAVKVGKNREMQLQVAASAMDLYARNNYVEMFRETTLGAVIRGKTGVAANDADQVLGLLWAALNDGLR